MGKKTIAKNGREVQVHYKGTLKDGTVFDNSYERGSTIAFTVGAGDMIPGFEAEINGMKVGEKKNFTLKSDDAYGPYQSEGVQEINKSYFPNNFEFKTGLTVEGQVGSSPVRGVITKLQEETITVDFNHPLAGKDLNFEVELVTVS
tara:strand:+ start:269 stop:706 length:438 start_codon:yes stop_codon:yes gene_type:complete